MMKLLSYKYEFEFLELFPEKVLHISTVFFYKDHTWKSVCFAQGVLLERYLKGIREINETTWSPLLQRQSRAFPARELCSLYCSCQAATLFFTAPLETISIKRCQLGFIGGSSSTFMKSCY